MRRSNVIRVVPTPITSPFISDVSVTRWPFTSVPFVDPRSTSEKPSPDAADLGVAARHVGIADDDVAARSSGRSRPSRPVEVELAAVPQEHRHARAAAAGAGSGSGSGSGSERVDHRRARRCDRDVGQPAAGAASRSAPRARPARLASPACLRLLLLVAGLDRDPEHPDVQVVLGLERDDGPRRGRCSPRGGRARPGTPRARCTSASRRP